MSLSILDSGDLEKLAQQLFHKELHLSVKDRDQLKLTWQKYAE